MADYTQGLFAPAPAPAAPFTSGQGALALPTTAPTLAQNVRTSAPNPVSTSNTMAGAMTGNPYAAAAGAGVDLLLTGYNIYNNERARRSQARTLKREISRQEAIRQADLAEESKWKQIQYAMQKEDRQFSKEEYNKIKQVEYFQRLLDNMLKVANNDAQMKQILMSRLT